jgi:hypothetical protein
MTNPKRALGNAGEAGIVKRAIAVGLSALRQPGSGQFKDYPADLTLDNGSIRVLGESKVRSVHVTPSGAANWTINLDWLRKVVREARDHGFDHAALFVRPKRSVNDHFVLIEESVYLDLLRRSR